MTTDNFDLVVIGGGINGAGIAADAAGRGLSVLLAEAGDLAGATSSASSKLIHGGLRYLEHYAFRLVREALGEREVLLSKAPHIIWPLRFVLPHQPGMRPAIMLRAGLFLYDHLSVRRTLAGSRSLDLRRDAAGKPLSQHLKRGFAYWDCWVDDARLVVANALAARDHGAEVLTRTPVTALSSDGQTWQVTLAAINGPRIVSARAIVNAAGPWVETVGRLAFGIRSAALPHIKMVKGSHIVVPRIAGADNAYIFQHSDGRVIFALPYEGRFSLIGTTDSAFAGNPGEVIATVEEQQYLIDAANRYFRVPLSLSNIVWSFAGVRPLDDDGSENPSDVSRDYRLELTTDGGPPIVHVIGGKITTYRRLAEGALQQLAPHLNMGPAWTATAALPGGDVGSGGFAAWFDNLASRYPGFSKSELERYARRYGTRTDLMIDGAKVPVDLGSDFGGGLREKEVAFLKDEEWAKQADDVLWRRTKTALHVPPDERRALAEKVQRALDGA